MSNKPSAGGEKGEFDAIVVGSGPGGATVARELTRRGWRVLILEWGGKRAVTGSSWQALLELGIPGRGLFPHREGDHGREGHHDRGQLDLFLRHGV